MGSGPQDIWVWKKHRFRLCRRSSSVKTKLTVSCPLRAALPICPSLICSVPLLATCAPAGGREMRPQQQRLKAGGALCARRGCAGRRAISSGSPQPGPTPGRGNPDSTRPGTPNTTPANCR